MKLVELDRVDAEPLDAGLALVPQVRWVAVALPFAGSSPGHAALGRDHEIIGVGEECVVDVLLVHLWAVRVGSVDQRDAHLNCGAQHGVGVVDVRYRPPNAVAC